MHNGSALCESPFARSLAHVLPEIVDPTWSAMVSFQLSLKGIRILETHLYDIAYMYDMLSRHSVRTCACYHCWHLCSHGVSAPEPLAKAIGPFFVERESSTCRTPVRPQPCRKTRIHVAIGGIAPPAAPGDTFSTKSTSGSVMLLVASCLVATVARGC